MYDFWNGTKGYRSFAYFVFDNTGNIKSLLIGFLQSVSPGLFAKLTTRSVILQSPLYTEEADLRLLLEHYKEAIKWQAIYTEIRNHVIDENYTSLCKLLGFQWEGHYNIVKQLPETDELLWKEIGRKRKDGINKAKRYGFIIDKTINPRSIEIFYGLLKTNYKSLGLPIPDKDFFDICLSDIESSYCRLFNLVEDGSIRISLLAFAYKSKLHALYIGIDKDYTFLNKRPVDFFYYEIMKWCLANNISNFDWMGAGKPGEEYGVRDFKLQYGGNLEDYGRFKIIHMPIIETLARHGFRLIGRLRRKK